MAYTRVKRYPWYYSPLRANTGIIFNVSDKQGNSVDLRANLGSVGATDLCTVLGKNSGAHAATIEHLMAALRALDVDNVIVELDGSEVPVMDGSSAVFVDGIKSIGLMSLAASRCYIRVNKPVRVDMGASWGEFVPYEGSRFEVEIDFECDAIGRQRFASDITEGVFCRELSRGPYFWLHEGCRAALGCRFLRLDLHSIILLLSVMITRSSILRACVTRTSLFVIKRWMLLAIWLLRARRSLVATSRIAVVTN